MNPAGTPSGGRDTTGTKEADSKTKKTPNTDMQGDDAGTPESGNTGTSGRGTAAEGAMKQTSKTDSEGGSRR